MEFQHEQIKTVHTRGKLLHATAELQRVKQDAGAVQIVGRDHFSAARTIEHTVEVGEQHHAVVHLQRSLQQPVAQLSRELIVIFGTSSTTQCHHHHHHHYHHPSCNVRVLGDRRGDTELHHGRTKRSVVGRRSAACLGHARLRRRQLLRQPHLYTRRE